MMQYLRKNYRFGLDKWGAALFPAVILALAGFPCAAFLLYEASRKNWIALFPTEIFTICHLISSATNFII